MNKEIEELLNMLKKCAREDKATLKLNEIACKTILSYIEQLNLENKFAKEYEKNYRETYKKYKQLENNRDKAIEVINTQLKNADGGTKDNLRIIKFNLIKGSCTFEDLKTEEDYKYVLKGDSDE